MFVDPNDVFVDPKVVVVDLSDILRCFPGCSLIQSMCYCSLFSWLFVDSNDMFVDPNIVCVVQNNVFVVVR